MTSCYLQDPINGNDECDVIGRQAHWCQNDHHGNQTSLRNPRRPNASSRSRNAVGNRRFNRKRRRSERNGFRSQELWAQVEKEK